MSKCRLLDTLEPKFSPQIWCQNSSTMKLCVKPLTSLTWALSWFHIEECFPHKYEYSKECKILCVIPCKTHNILHREHSSNWLKWYLQIFLSTSTEKEPSAYSSPAASTAIDPHPGCIYQSPVKEPGLSGGRRLQAGTSIGQKLKKMLKR